MRIEQREERLQNIREDWTKELESLVDRAS